MSNWNGKYVELDTIIERLFRNADYRDEVSIEECMEWVGDAIGLIGYPAVLMQKVTDGNNSLDHPDPISIVDYKGIIPAGVHSVIGVRDAVTKQRFRLSEDSFHMATDTNDDAYLPTGIPSYKLQGNFIFTDVKTTTLEMSYNSLPVSLTGLPLIPDETNYILAVEWYIREKIDYKLFRRGSLQQAVYQHTEQQLAWYIGKAQTAMLMPNEDEMEVIQNIRLRLLPQINDWNNFFKATGVVEQRRIHSRPNRFYPGGEVNIIGINGTTE